KAEDPRRIAVWVAMAEQFLDTESRQDIPLTAMRCVEAGLSVAETRHVWRYEVSPAVWWNVWSVAGEWDFWDSEWLGARIRDGRSNWSNRVDPLRWLFYRARVHFMHGNGVAIERCVAALLAATPDERESMSRDMAALARHYFDFCPDNLAEQAREQLHALYPEPFRYIMAPATLSCERASTDRRVRAALGMAER